MFFLRKTGFQSGKQVYISVDIQNCPDIDCSTDEKNTDFFRIIGHLASIEPFQHLNYRLQTVGLQTKPNQTKPMNYLVKDGRQVRE